MDDLHNVVRPVIENHPGQAHRRGLMTAIAVFFSGGQSTPGRSRTTAITSAVDNKMTGIAVTHGGKIIAKATAARYRTTVVRSLVMTPGSLTAGRMNWA